MLYALVINLFISTTFHQFLWIQSATISCFFFFLLLILCFNIPTITETKDEAKKNRSNQPAKYLNILIIEIGPATVPMVSQGGSPPVAMPVQVPPGHVMQQIVDEHRTLRHVILSTNHQMHAQSTVQDMPHLQGHYVS